MKKHILVLAIIMISFDLSAQTDSLCTNFETPAFFVKNLSGSWQIGSPGKVIFSSSYSPVRSIVTDTVTPYDDNDSSVFYAVYAPEYLYNYLDVYFPFRIEFYHRYDTDSLNDFGSVELSIDGGNHWIDGLSDTLNISYAPSSNSHIFLSTNDTIFDSLTISGNSNGWVHSTITKDINSWYWNAGLQEPDSIIVKFTFKSDSINNSKDGWQIDDLCLDYLISLGVEEKVTGKNYSLYPNPCINSTTLNASVSLNHATLNILNLYGKKVKQIRNINGRSFILQRENLSSGIYFLQLTQDDKIIGTEKLVVN